MSVLLRVWGDRACFTRPEFKAERVSYDVMTPSAARGIMESIYWHPGVTWKIEKIWVRKPVKFTNIRRNEFKNILNSSAVISSMRAKTALPVCEEGRTQRNTLALKDVEYYIQAYADVDGNVIPPWKVDSIIMRRLNDGGSYSQPYLGCREFSANFELIQFVPACPDSLKGQRDLGWMLYDMDYSDKDNPQPMFFRAEMVDGLIEIPKRGFKS